jgi:endonuclease YncB( thermonuclease family)
MACEPQVHVPACEHVAHIPESLAVVDLKLDKCDRFGRLLRHVFEGKRNANLVVVKQGAASVWFEGDRGRCAKRLLRAARTA